MTIKEATSNEVIDNTNNENNNINNENNNINNKNNNENNENIDNIKVNKKTSYKFNAEIQNIMEMIIKNIYNDKSASIRELISNCSDALDKYISQYALIDSNEKTQIPNLKIIIKINLIEKYIEILDNGIGMTKTDLINFIGSIATSGTKEFKKMNLKNTTNDSSNLNNLNNLIGQFGVGFYSSFLIADKVMVITKAIGVVPYKWISEGKGDYVIEELGFDDFELKHGTLVRLYIKEGDEKYLKSNLIKDIVGKHSGYINYPIYIEEDVEEGEGDNKIGEGEGGDNKVEELDNDRVMEVDDDKIEALEVDKDLDKETDKDLDFENAPPTRPPPSADTLSAGADKVSASVAATDDESSVGINPINRIDSPSPALAGSVALSIPDESGIDFPPTRPSPSPTLLLPANAANIKVGSVAATDNKLSVGINPINRIESISPASAGSVALSIPANKLAGINPPLNTAPNKNEPTITFTIPLIYPPQNLTLNTIISPTLTDDDEIETLTINLPEISLTINDYLLPVTLPNNNNNTFKYKKTITLNNTTINIVKDHITPGLFVYKENILILITINSNANNKLVNIEIMSECNELLNRVCDIFS
ncbi:heat shock protein 90 [Cucumispora dikerogammari]|nr:heat shock protein 90 [Cucumispora dikerogammari]